MPSPRLSMDASDQNTKYVPVRKCVSTNSSCKLDYRCPHSASAGRSKCSRSGYTCLQCLLRWQALCVGGETTLQLQPINNVRTTLEDFKVAFSTPRVLTFAARPSGTTTYLATAKLIQRPAAEEKPASGFVKRIDCIESYTAPKSTRLYVDDSVLKVKRHTLSSTLSAITLSVTVYVEPEKKTRGRK